MADEKHAQIDALLQENRHFDPPPAFVAAAHVRDPKIYEEAARDPEAFWAKFAAELEWSTPWTKVLDWQPPHAKWFVGGKLNASVNCLDRHVRGWRRNKAAIIWEGEPGDRRTITYWELYREVCQFANVLKSLGIRKGDRVALYLPLIPELAIAMLACARIGAVHSVVFGGFSAESLRDRINDQQARLLITADGGYRRGNVVQLKRVADEALAGHAVDRERHRRAAPHQQPVHRRVHRRARPLVPRPDAQGAARVRAGADGCRGHALHPLHVGHDGKAQGHRPHDRRVSHRVLRHHEVGLRPEGRGRLLVHGRHRLGDRAQLRGVRAAGQRRDGRDVRGRAGFPAQGSVLGDRRALRRHDLLHGADGDSRVHEVGPRVARAPRPLVAAAAGLGRRADQPRSVDVVPPLHRSRALPDRRHLVADRNGPHPDHAAAGHHADQARLGHASVPRHRGRDPQRRRIGRRRRRRPARADQAVAGHACAASTATWSATRSRYLEPLDARHLLHRRRRQAR